MILIMIRLLVLLLALPLPRFLYYFCLYFRSTANGLFFINHIPPPPSRTATIISSSSSSFLVDNSNNHHPPSGRRKSRRLRRSSRIRRKIGVLFSSINDNNIEVDNGGDNNDDNIIRVGSRIIVTYEGSKHQNRTAIVEKVQKNRYSVIFEDGKPGKFVTIGHAAIISSSSSSTAIDEEEEEQEPAGTLKKKIQKTIDGNNDNRTPSKMDTATTDTSKIKFVAAIERNKQIINLGKQQKWEDILNLYEHESNEFNNVNYATTLSQLSRIMRYDHDERTNIHPVFVDFMDDLATRILQLGLDWIGIRQISDILHCIVRMKLLGTKSKTTTTTKRKTSSSSSSRSSVTAAAAVAVSARRIIEFASQKGNSKMIIESGNPKAMSSINIVKSKIAIQRNQRIVFMGKKRQWEQILTLYKREGEDFNNVNLATTISQLQRIIKFNSNGKTMTSHPLFQEFMIGLAETIKHRGLEWIGIRELSNIVHAIGKMQLTTTTNCPAAKKIIQFTSQPHNAKSICTYGLSQSISNICWSMASLGSKEDFICFFQQGLEQQPQIFEDFISKSIPQGLSITAWSCATIGYESPAFFSHIERRAVWLVQNGNPQEISNTAWACSTLNIQYCPTLFTEIERSASWLVENGKQQAVANTIWSFANLGIKSPMLFQEIERRPSWLFEEEDEEGNNRNNPQTVTNTAWACATLGVKSPMLFAEIERHASWLVEHGTPQAISNLAWACATLQVSSPTLFREIEQRSTWFVQKAAKPQAISNTAWACATLNIQSPKLFAEIERRIPWLIENGTEQDIENTARAFSILGIQSSSLPLLIATNKS